MTVQAEPVKSSVIVVAVMYASALFSGERRGARSVGHDTLRGPDGREHAQRRVAVPPPTSAVARGFRTCWCTAAQYEGRQGSKRAVSRETGALRPETIEKFFVTNASC
ncbi:hypothetical protein [Mycobacterium gallinarum]|uniref:hypothetical protein n=1 Tax=Mycobacterium gallinarum TaxID=39689 RepID=UPI0013CFB5AA|nr:hypothetical protein [Mycobacterium gallinarum]